MGSAAEPALAAQVEDLGLAAEDGRDDRGVGSEPPGLSGGDPLSGVQVGGFEAADQGVEGHGDHDGGVEAAGLGELLGGVARDVFAERQPEAFGAWLAFLERAA